MNRIFYAILIVFLFAIAAAYSADMSVIDARIDKEVSSGNAKEAQQWATLKLILTQCERDKQAAEILGKQNETVKRIDALISCTPKILDTIKKYAPKESMDEDSIYAINMFKSIISLYMNPNPETAEKLTKASIDDFTAIEKAREEKRKKEEAERIQRKKSNK